MTRIVGDCREVLATLEAGSVQTCVTSPPYWGLRDYGTARWEGGKARCDHKGGRNVALASTTHGAQVMQSEGLYRDTCGKCGARRIDAQLGLEATPEEYVANMVEVFREVRRVLADDGRVGLI